MASIRTQGSLGRNKERIRKDKDSREGKNRIYTGVYEKTELATTPYSITRAMEAQNPAWKAGFFIARNKHTANNSIKLCK